MKRNILGAFIIFAVTIAILVLLNNFSTPIEGKTKEQIAVEHHEGKKNPDLATHRSNQ